MNRLLLSAHEIDEIKLLLKRITSEHPLVESERFLNDVGLYAHDLPLRVRRFLNNFRLLEASYGVSVISGYPIDDQKIGPTPAHWQDRSATSKTRSPLSRRRWGASSDRERRSAASNAAPPRGG